MALDINQIRSETKTAQRANEERELRERNKKNMEVWDWVNSRIDALVIITEKEICRVSKQGQWDIIIPGYFYDDKRTMALMNELEKCLGPGFHISNRDDPNSEVSRQVLWSVSWK